jgi:hypothetical protein
MRSNGLILAAFALVLSGRCELSVSQSPVNTPKAEWAKLASPVKTLLCEEYSGIVTDECNPQLVQTARLPDGRLIGLFELGAAGAYTDQMAFLESLGGKIQNPRMAGTPGKRGTIPGFLSGSSVRHSAHVEMSKDGRLISTSETETDQEGTHVTCVSAYVFEWSPKRHRYEYSARQSFEYLGKCGGTITSP